MKLRRRTRRSDNATMIMVARVLGLWIGIVAGEVAMHSLPWVL